MNRAVFLFGGVGRAAAWHGRRSGRRSPNCGGGLLFLLIPVAGCQGLLNSWLDPSAVGNFADERTLEIRTALSIQDSPGGIPGATDPTPGDLVSIPRLYCFTAGDTLIVRIFELLAAGTETAVEPVVDEAGTIRLPVIGTIRAAGLTARELEEEIIDHLEQNDLLHDAQVIVEPVIRRNSTFVVFGAAAGPNLYPLPTPDYRLLEALSVAGGLADTVTDVYVFRTEPAPTEEPPGGVVPPPSEAPAESEGYGSVHLSGGLDGAVLAAGGLYVLPRSADPPADEPAAKPASGPRSRPSDEDARRELIESVAPAQTQPAQGPAAESQPSETQAAATQSQWIFLNGKWIEVRPEVAEQAQPGPSRTVPQEEAVVEFPEFPQPTVDWGEVAGEEQHRIIHVSAEGLRNGDPRQNIIVRPGDTLRLMAGEPGEYYVMGQINRPGAYAFGGRKLTLKTAVAAAGDLAPLAWPERCTVYRRLGDREEMIQVNLDRIFAGKESDFYLKNHDLIVVGTHPAAVFLAVVRNAFRLTYGFGFVYDRNFADVDIASHEAAAQAKAYQEAQQQNRFPGLFP